MTSWFFALAGLYALLVVPAWLWISIHWPALLTASWHGHEMLFGFALAVVAGFLVTRPSRAMILVLLAGWLTSRAAPFVSLDSLALVCGLAFPIALLAATVPTLLGSAKRWENRIAPLVLVALWLTDMAWWAGWLWLGTEWQQRALLAAIDLFALMLLIFGGRALQAAMGGYLERQGLPRRDPVRSGHERPLALLMLGAVLADAGDQTSLAGLCCLAAALLTLHRVWSWQLGHMFRKPRLWTLGVGYCWLVAGLLLKALAQLQDGIPLTVLLHGLGIGAIGSLTLVMMARTASLRARQSLEPFRDIAAAVILITAAAGSRLLAGFNPAVSQHLLWLSVLCWSAAFLILLRRLLRPASPTHSPRIR
ncbi:MAG: NnrS family protein [Gammaproteobacteria bacterium]|nr:NnrS family protein [Gammaproteobacteria bacterium]